MKKALILCCILTITALSFLPSLENGFVNWDDNIHVTENQDITSLSRESLRQIFTTTVLGTYTPLVILTYALEYAASGLNPFIYHFDNLVLHLCNCLLVFWFILLVSQKLEIAAIVTLFFGIHPLNVESVAWVTERKDMLYSLFFLSSLVSYYYYKKTGGGCRTGYLLFVSCFHCCQSHRQY